jgi:ABC-type polysaccharide transport system permease subunit
VNDLVEIVLVFVLAISEIDVVRRSIRSLIAFCDTGAEIGVLNYLLKSVGLPGSLWVSSAKTVIPALVMVDVWKWTPMITLIVLAGLKSLPHEPYEAARVDGASALQIFWYITLPLIRPVLIAALMLRSLDNLKEFDMIYTITQGGPGIASETLYLYSYNVGFSFFKAGYGSALMVVVFLIVLVFNVAMNRMRLSAGGLESVADEQRVEGAAGPEGATRGASHPRGVGGPAGGVFPVARAVEREDQPDGGPVGERDCP